MASNITMVVTSCDRHDLLKDTLNSLIAEGRKPAESVLPAQGTYPSTPTSGLKPMIAI
jgi:hypothetical protein